MDERRFLMRFGESEVAEGVLSASIEPAGPAGEGVASATVVISNQVLADANVDYLAEVRIFAVTNAEPDILFTGIVDTVIPGEDEAEIKLVTMLQLLEESRIGGLGLSAGTNLLEVAWSLLRTSGIEPDMINIEGFEPGPLEVFEVATALDGLELHDPIRLGEVHVLPAGQVSQLAGTLGPEELRETYASASTWALTLQRARTLVEAEAIGLKTIDVALAWLTTRTRFSAPLLPARSPRQFRRSWTISRVSRRDVFVVRGLASGRRWLRAPTDLPNQPILHLQEIDDLAAIPMPQNLPVEMREALLAWRRAAEEVNPLDAVVALWEAIEFYASGAEAAESKMFARSERKAICEGATKGLHGAKLQRVEQLLAMLNQPSLLMSLRVALQEDEVPYTDEEFTLLRKVRHARNELVHGRSPEAPPQDDMRLATAIVNRMLVYRMSRLTAPKSASARNEVTAASLLRKIADPYT